MIEQQIIKDENNDRRLVYEEIANRTKAPVRQVGARRAEAIARQARSGTWLQNAAGEWQQKR